MTLALIDVPRCLNVDAPTWAGPVRGCPTERGRCGLEQYRKTARWRSASRRHANVSTRLPCCGRIASLSMERGGSFRPIGAAPAHPGECDHRPRSGGAQAGNRPVARRRRAGFRTSVRGVAGARIAEGRHWLEPAREIFIAATLRHPAEAAAAVEALGLVRMPRSLLSWRRSSR